MMASVAMAHRTAAAAGAVVRPPASSRRASGPLCNSSHNAIIIIIIRNDRSARCDSDGWRRSLLPLRGQASIPTRLVARQQRGWSSSSSSSHIALPPLLRRRRTSSSSAGGTVDFSSDFVEEEEAGEDVVPAPPPSEGRIDIVVTKDAIRQLDLSVAHAVLRKFVKQVGDHATAPSSDPKELLGRTVGFVLKYEPDDPLDPRELSEMPDIRLWFLRLDVTYPWLPIVLDWRAGELARYAAMLVPHQMSKRQGLVFNPEALELFAMRKVFLLHSWLKIIGIPKPKTRLNDMLKMLGFTVTDQLYSLIEEHPPP